MRFRTPRDYRNNAGHPQFCALFNRPLHAIELEDGKQNGHRGNGALRNSIAERELNAIIINRDDLSPADAQRRNHVELLPNSDPQNTREMGSVFSKNECSVSGDFVGDPTAASHVELLVEDFANFAQKTSFLRFILDARMAVQFLQ